MFRWKEDPNVIQNTNIKRGITNSFARTLKTLQQKHLQFSQEEFIYSNDASNNLCNSLEAAFLHGLKDSMAHKLTMYVGLAASSEQCTDMNFWGVVAKFTHSDVITQLQALSQITTEIGLCRAWVRLALNDGLMESYLHSMIVDTKTLKYFYHSHSFLRDHEQPGILKNLLTGLMSLDFKLSCNSSVLNSWSNTTLQLIGALDTQRAPSPAISQADRGQAVSVTDTHQKTGQILKPDVASTDTSLATSQSIDSPVIKNSSDAVADVQQITVADTRSDDISKPALTTSEDLLSSHMSHQELHVGTVRQDENRDLETKLAENLLLKAESGSLLEKSTNLTLTDQNFQDNNHISWENIECPAQVPEKGISVSDEVVIRGRKSPAPVRLGEGGHLDSSTTSSRRRRVDEEDLKRMYSSSVSPSRPRSRRVDEKDNIYSISVSPSRPRSRRVDEGDLRYILSSSVSPSRSGQANEKVIQHVSPFRPQSGKANEEVIQHVSSSRPQSGNANDEVIQHISPSRPQSEKSNDEDIQQVTFSNISPLSLLEAADAQEISNQREEETEDIVYTASKDHHKKNPHQHLDASQKSCLPSAKPDGSNDLITQASDGNRVQIVNKAAEGHQIYPGVAENRATSLQTASCDNVLSLADELKNSMNFGEGQDEDYEIDESIFAADRNNTHSDNLLDDCSSSNLTVNREHGTDGGTHDESIAGDRAQEIPRGAGQIRNTEEVESEVSMSPSRFGNSLGSLSGWSSEIESRRERKQRASERNREVSFATMLRAYSPAVPQPSQAVTLSQVIETLPCDKDEEQDDDGGDDDGSRSHSPIRDSEEAQCNDSGLEDFEVLKSPAELFCGQVEANSSRMFFLFHVPREHGLSHQNFSCKGCSRQIGLIYGSPHLCEFDGGLYCSTCHENSETYIPSSILFDWDFRKKKVCQENYKFLLELEEQALFDVEELNPKLYNHVPELQDLKLLRQQLCYLKSYLFTCSQKVAESLRQKVWPREHLYNKRDVYSIMDFVQVQSGSLQRLVKDLVKFASQHVYDCVLCSLKGFVCEICRNPQVIYPFELETTMRCKKCKAVYHKTCMTESLPCPKCERWGHHLSNSNLNEDNPEDYGTSPRT